MECPACSGTLHEVVVEDITLDVCREGCAGIWFDNHELQKVDEAHESAGESLLEIARAEGVRVDHTRKRSCPRCDGQVMMQHFFSVKREVEVDECPACGGFWLDHGELGAIRTQFDTEDERKEAAKAYFEEVFGEDLDKMRSESQEKLERVQRITRIFRFLCPSYYIPGKQSWGAY